MKHLGTFLRPSRISLETASVPKNFCKTPWKLPWKTLETWALHAHLKLPFELLSNTLFFLEILFNIPQNTLETFWKYHWNFLKTLLKPPWNSFDSSLKHPWNFPDTFFELLSNTLESYLHTPFNLPWNTLDTSFSAGKYKTSLKHPRNYLETPLKLQTSFKISWNTI